MMPITLRLTPADNQKLAALIVAHRAVAADDHRRLHDTGNDLLQFVREVDVDRDTTTEGTTP